MSDGMDAIREQIKQCEEWIRNEQKWLDAERARPNSDSAKIRAHKDQIDRYNQEIYNSKEIIRHHLS